MEIELPGMEQMPGIILVAHKTELGIKARPKRKKDKLEEHKTYINGVSLRVIGVAFASLPTISMISSVGFVTGYNPANGAPIKKNIIEVVFTREQWQGIDFLQAKPAQVIAANKQYSSVMALIQESS